MSGEVYVFLGPTLSVERARSVLDAVYLPPVSEGDVYRVARRNPRAIGIVDGFFERVPAVWHKEIMWAMANGTHVFGSASMGALRAAELAQFGMRGVGWVADAFARGELDRDDEVAVAHFPDESFRPISEALVNVRRTVAKAQASSVVSAATGSIVVGAAAELFYRERNWPAIVATAADAGADPGELEGFERWLPEGMVDQKALDALEMLEQMRDLVVADVPPCQVPWRLADTVAWNAARRRARSLPGSASSRTPGTVDPLLDEMRLLGPVRYEASRQRAILRLLASEAAEQDASVPHGVVPSETLDQFRLRKGIDRQTSLHAYLDENELSLQEFEVLVRTDEQVRRTMDDLEREALADLAHDLRVAGEYAAMVRRARDKENVLAECGLLHASPEDVGLDAETVERWYFEERLGETVPGDLAAHARESGFPDELSFRRAVWREYFYAVTAAKGSGRWIGDAADLPEPV
jgi:hypothetical protein